jgi:hypothetical protein
MKKISTVTISILSTILCAGTAHSSNSIPNTDNPKTFLGPTAMLGLTSNIGTASAFSINGEAGAKNFRLGGTIGWNIGDNQRFKVTADYLWQRITYAFFAGDVDQWSQQGMIGAAYQYDLGDYRMKPQLDFNGFLSHSPSKTTGILLGLFVNPQGVTQNFTDNRRTTGSNGLGVSPGITFVPWLNGKMSAEVNYDKIFYDKNYFPTREDTNGFGGTLRLKQKMTDRIGLDLLAAFRQPFNNFAASLSWSTTPGYGFWIFGLFGEYTAGKRTLPTTYDAGISIDWMLDRRHETVTPSLKGELPVSQPIKDALMEWTATPAVYLPQVLSITDEQVTLD